MHPIDRPHQAITQIVIACVLASGRGRPLLRLLGFGTFARFSARPTFWGVEVEIELWARSFHLDRGPPMEFTARHQAPVHMWLTSNQQP